MTCNALYRLSPHMWTGGVIQAVQYICWNLTIPRAFHRLYHTETVRQCHQYHSFLLTAFIASFLIKENMCFICLKCKDSRIHQGTLLYPRRRNQGEETAVHTQILSLYPWMLCSWVNSTPLMWHLSAISLSCEFCFILIGSCFAPKDCSLETSRHTPG